MLRILNWKYRFFKKKIRQVQCAIADLEFKLFKVRELREERRKQHDRSLEALDQLNSKLTAQDLKEDQKTALETSIKEQEEYQKHIKDQIDALDAEINGKKNEVVGIIEQIEGHRELLTMYKEYVRFNL